MIIAHRTRRFNRLPKWRFSGSVTDRTLRFLILVCAIFPPTMAQPSTAISAICDSAAELASQKTGVPISVLRAISLTETGRKKGVEFEPWPWTVNMEGKGVWFDDRQQAQNYVDRNFARGARSFDVGCFQLNYKWHGQAFASVEEMFDPSANATYAANFLLDLFHEKGNWSDAAGAYHSRTPKYANRYIRRFQRLLSDLDEKPPLPPKLPTANVVNPTSEARGPARINRFPLLFGADSTHASLGSLMPASAGSGAPRLFGGG